MIEFEEDLKKSPLHFFLAIAKQELDLRSAVWPSVCYKRGNEAIPIVITPLSLFGIPNLPAGPVSAFEILAAVCQVEKLSNGPADELVLTLACEKHVFVSWIRPGKVKTMRFEIIEEFGVRRAGKEEDVEESRFDGFRKILN